MLDLGLIYLHFSVLFSVFYLQKMIKQNAQKAADGKKAPAVAEEEDDEDEDEVRNISILLIETSQYLVNSDYLNMSLFAFIFSHLSRLLFLWESRRFDLLDIRTVSDCMTCQLISVYLQYLFIIIYIFMIFIVCFIFFPLGWWGRWWRWWWRGWGTTSQSIERPSPKGPSHTWWSEKGTTGVTAKTRPIGTKTPDPKRDP